MITLITGTPGAGKTAWIIAQLLKLQITQPHRRLLVHGIKAFKLSHIQVFCKSPLCDICRAANLPDDAIFLEDWHKWKLTNDLIVADEVQRIWRNSNGAKSVQEDITLLETHRHYGIDFWLVTQSTKILHTGVKVMVGRHIHLVGKWSGRTEYEWPEIQEDVGSRSGAVSRPYKLPAHVYKFYKSAEVHTKQDKRKPFSFYILVAAVLFSIIAVSYAVFRISNKTKPVNVPPVPVAGVGASAPASGSGTGGMLSDVNKSFPDFKPTIQGVPESAPAYLPLVKVVSAPLLAGCVYSIKKDLCSCYTNQATPYSASRLYCMEVVQNHRFNPYIGRSFAGSSSSNDGPVLPDRRQPIEPKPFYKSHDLPVNDPAQVGNVEHFSTDRTMHYAVN